MRFVRQAQCPTTEIVDFYLECRRLAGETLVDGQGEFQIDGLPALLLSGERFTFCAVQYGYSDRRTCSALTVACGPLSCPLLFSVVPLPPGRSPRFSLRTLSRSLSFSRLLMRSFYPQEQALYEGFCMNFLTQLDHPSRNVLRNRIKQVFAPRLSAGQLRFAPPNPTGDARNASVAAMSASAAAAAAAAAAASAAASAPSDRERRRRVRSANLAAGRRADLEYVKVANFWIEKGPGEVNLGETDEVDRGGNESFIVTPTVQVGRRIN